MPNMALREMSNLRPHLVLESHCAKNGLRERLRGEKGEKLGEGDFFPFLPSKVIKHLG